MRIFRVDGMYALAGQENNMQQATYLVDRGCSSGGRGGLRACAPTTERMSLEGLGP